MMNVQSDVRGRLITLEGIEGAGKTTHLEIVRQHMQSYGIQVRVTREPGGTRVGEEIRRLLLSHRVDRMAVDSELLLMFAARAEHLAQVISPALAAGQWVLCDRFTDSTYAYQGGGRGVGKERIRMLEQWVQGPLHPDLVLLFDLPVLIGLQRARQMGLPDRFESEQQSFFARVRAAYLELAEQHAGRYRVVDAVQPIASVQAQVLRIIDQFLAENGYCVPQPLGEGGRTDKAPSPYLGEPLG